MANKLRFRGAAAAAGPSTLSNLAVVSHDLLLNMVARDPGVTSDRWKDQTGRTAAFATNTSLADIAGSDTAVDPKYWTIPAANAFVYTANQLDMTGKTLALWFWLPAATPQFTCLFGSSKVEVLKVGAASWGVNFGSNPGKYFSSQPSEQAWHHLVVDQGGGKIYLDGNDVTGGNTGGWSAYTNTYPRIGFDGYDAVAGIRVAKWRVWNVALTPTEVADEFAEGPGPGTQVGPLNIAPTRMTTDDGNVLKNAEYWAAWQVFDSNDGTTWFAHENGSYEWVGYHFSTAFNVVKYRFRGAGAHESRSWRLQYSDNGIAWSDADVVSGQNIGAVYYTSGVLASVGAHAYWRIYWDGSDDILNLEIATVEFWAI